MKTDKSSSLLSNQTSHRNLSKAGRERQAEAGRRNLEAWYAKADADTLAQIERFRAELMTELGQSPSCTRRALAEALIANYGAILRVQSELRKKRSRDRLRVVEHASWLIGNLSRLLKSLNLDAKPRPRSLADLIEQKPAGNGQIPAQNSTIPEVTPDVR